MSWRQLPSEVVDDVTFYRDTVEVGPVTAPLGGGEARNRRYTGIKALMVAVLEDGLRCYFSPVGPIRTEAEYWATNGRRDWPFCFNTVCEMLDLDAGAVRTAMLRMRAQYASQRRVRRRSRPNVRQPGQIGFPTGRSAPRAER